MKNTILYVRNVFAFIYCSKSKHLVIEGLNIIRQDFIIKAVNPKMIQLLDE